MHEPPFLKCACDHCGEHIEFPSEAANQVVECPHCRLTTRLAGTSLATMPGVPAPFDLWIPAKMGPSKGAETVYGRIKSKAERAGLGCLLQLLGLCLLFWFPIGTAAGVVLFAVGRLFAKKLVCSQCGNAVVDKGVTLCPVCKCTLITPAPENRPLGWIILGVAAVLGLAGYFVYQEWMVPKENAPEASELEVIAYALEKTDYGSTLVTGTLTNHSAKTFPSVRVEFTLYDTNQAQLGTATDFLQNLAGNGAWKFRAHVFADNAAEARLLKVKVQ